MDNAATVAAVAINGECEQSRREALINDGADRHLRIAIPCRFSTLGWDDEPGAILVEREKGSRAVVVVQVRGQNAAQITLKMS